MSSALNADEVRVMSELLAHGLLRDHHRSVKLIMLFDAETEKAKIYAEDLKETRKKIDDITLKNTELSEQTTRLETTFEVNKTVIERLNAAQNILIKHTLDRRKQLEAAKQHLADESVRLADIVKHYEAMLTDYEEEPSVHSQVLLAKKEGELAALRGAIATEKQDRKEQRRKMNRETGFRFATFNERVAEMVLTKQDTARSEALIAAREASKELLEKEAKGHQTDEERSDGEASAATATDIEMPDDDATRSRGDRAARGGAETAPGRREGNGSASGSEQVLQAALPQDQEESARHEESTRQGDTAGETQPPLDLQEPEEHLDSTQQAPLTKPQRPPQPIKPFDEP
ncbi:uncharacterized protein LOC133362843 [Lethenteron reissneri]|uniref:uncharacterized protein LOC133362843 n=1 Tax=Lethenteron reissneri TaxID=7753 RepID=UPI002AB734CC|nr:uncharacterized protein LOC133362843 [Lethenteron reissneri]